MPDVLYDCRLHYGGNWRLVLSLGSSGGGLYRYCDVNFLDTFISLSVSSQMKVGEWLILNWRYGEEFDIGSDLGSSQPVGGDDSAVRRVHHS